MITAASRFLFLLLALFATLFFLFVLLHCTAHAVDTFLGRYVMASGGLA